MYLDFYTLVAILIALVSQLIMNVILFRSAYKWEQHYRNAIRILRVERETRK
jgi:hypothetical protein